MMLFITYLIGLNKNLNKKICKKSVLLTLSNYSSLFISDASFIDFLRLSI